MVTSESILDLLKYGEHLTLECKKAESTLPNSVWETYSAFANTVGGIILFGIEEHRKEKDPAKRFAIVNIENPQARIMYSFSCGIVWGKNISEIDIRGTNYFGNCLFGRRSLQSTTSADAGAASNRHWKNLEWPC